jgi:hypothetical protein
MAFALRQRPSARHLTAELLEGRPELGMLTCDLTRRFRKSITIDIANSSRHLSIDRVPE